jgi:Uma2 family endonuclease
MDDMSIQTTKFTKADYMALPEGFPAQLIRGYLVKEAAPTPWHQGLVSRIARLLEALVDVNRVLCSPIDLFVDDESVLQPDVVVLPEGTVLGPHLTEIPVPDLVVEVLSPSTRFRDRGVKTEIYFEAGVAEVWLVDPDTRTIEMRTALGRAEVPESAVVPGFRPEPAEVFRIRAVVDPLDP